jgi:hypothetical protein
VSSLPRFFVEEGFRFRGNVREDSEEHGEAVNANTVKTLPPPREDLRAFLLEQSSPRGRLHQQAALSGICQMRRDTKTRIDDRKEPGSFLLSLRMSQDRTLKGMEEVERS